MHNHLKLSVIKETMPLAGNASVLRLCVVGAINTKGYEEH
jgi:hypothetical protein